MDGSVQTMEPRGVVRPEAWLRGGGLLGIWLLLLIFIVYPLLMLFSRADRKSTRLNSSHG